ncbi:MAG: DUF4142 domain-containing protein [Verrucomicrobiota bacterium]|nr:DUF4142 domain-containing protein [Verrucomicrobiota bacterium]
MTKSSHLFAAALTVAALTGIAGSAFAQEASPSAAPNKKYAPPPNENLSALQPSGSKPSKAELAKKKAEGGGNQSSSSSSTTTGASGGQASSGDRDFAMAAAKGGMMEVHMGEMAERMGKSAEVKKIGAMMVKDHTKANNELMAIAQAKGMKLDTRHSMDKLDSANFDQVYLDTMARDHQKDIAEFEKEAKSGSDPQLKMFARKTLPVIKKHYMMVQAAQKKMGNSGSGSSMKKS